MNQTNCYFWLQKSPKKTFDYQLGMEKELFVSKNQCQYFENQSPEPFYENDRICAEFRKIIFISEGFFNPINVYRI